MTSAAGGSLVLGVWNTVRTRFQATGVVTVWDTATQAQVAQQTFQFAPNHQDTAVRVGLAGLPCGARELRVEVRNADGLGAQRTVPYPVTC